MAAPNLISRLLSRTMAAAATRRRAPRQEQGLLDSASRLETLEDHLEFEQLLHDATVAPQPPSPRLQSRPKVDVRRNWQIGTCWHLEKQIYDRLLFIGCPRQFSGCIPRDWETLMKRARTPAQRQLCRQGAAVRARKEGGCRSRGWRKERKAFREVTTDRRNDTPVDCPAAERQRMTLRGVGAESPERERGPQRAAPPPGPPPARRVNRPNTRRTRRGGHGATSSSRMPAVGLSFASS